jgi:membrane protease YdiL (CAAX protease family)
MDASVVSQAWARLVTPPDDAVTGADRRTLEVVGLELPVRASIAVAVTTLLLLIDFSRLLVPPEFRDLGHTPPGARAIALERVIVWFVVPLAIIVLGFRDSPRRYGLTAGDAPAGAILAVVGCALLTPVVLWFATLPDVQAYYTVSAAPAADVVATNVLDLAAAELLFRGFLMFTLVRAIGPLGVLIAVMPFALGHLGKPVIELVSTPVGGLAYGWLAWRTRSIVWGSIAHVYIVSLVTLAAAGAAAATGTATP